MFEYINQFLKDNNLAQTGILMLFGGSVMGIVYKLYFKLVQLINYVCFVRLSFESVDYLNFKKVQYWLFNLPYTAKRCTNFNVRQVTKHKKDRIDYDFSSKVEESQIFYPGYGNHYLFLNRRPSILNYNKSDSKELAFRETINISIFAIFNKAKVAEAILEKINFLYDEVGYNKTSIYACVDEYATWKEILNKNIKQRPILSTEKEYDELVADIQKFYDNEQWYLDRGINYKRGFLFEGPPGTGKTTCILSLAQKFKKHVAIINLADADLTDKKLIELVTCLPPDTFLAIEDLEKIEEKPENGVSLATVLNILDGMLSPDQFVFFITTNYPERLNKNLMRKGRIDVQKTFDHANEYQTRTLLKRFFPDASEVHLRKFTKNSIGKPVSTLENHLQNHSSNIERAAEID